ncbi:signal transduction histidine kinase [Nocardioides luteus]|uniref:Two-component sensor histidine kinase n=1 Tax=Nocardioides luteus TaxID=1844 RepID=A0ABQ5T2C2_9ACTN|nr:sensor histidine kinase [Nocardioides luteus]MDR7313497.1 signal transduction histidine kinase [Nocardioides luteus]GGR73224.1 two-component sensor histidine kinase [Nocardioides luteus]GLJ70038.1 two-component sensor histidine kinase [Nocardioides luteus]
MTDTAAATNAAPNPAPKPGPAGGILAGQTLLDRWLHISLVVLVVASVARYLQGHGLGDQAAVVLPGAALLLVAYAAGRRLTGTAAIAWLVAVITCWTVLALIAPSFSWAAVPLVFVALRVLPFRWAVAATVFLVAVVAVAWSRMTGAADPTVLLGPVCVAVLAVTAYRALERDAVTRRALLADLEAAQDEVADAERRAGVVAERARLSREIHDSVAQGLTSINLLLQAADQEWESRPADARGHVDQAATMARTSLDEARRVVRDLAPTELTGGSALVTAVRQVADDVAATTGLTVPVHVHGDPHEVGGRVATAVVRTLRGALANVAEHADAATAVVSLTFHEAAVALDVRDDGAGFDPAAISDDADGLRGRGLAGMRARARLLGGDLAVESAPGEGTVVAVSFEAAQQTTTQQTPLQGERRG